MQVKEMTVDELKTLIRQTVTETLEEFIDDPDSGLELKPEVKQQLIESLQETQAGIRGVPAEEVAQKLGLDW
ncbi:MAG: hypothetical protein F6K47_07295 [Symploca sp. SIO2E6]|nr:hypothetical protein [Symploca sp. SIO2E6]